MQPVPLFTGTQGRETVTRRSSDLEEAREELKEVKEELAACRRRVQALEGMNKALAARLEKSRTGP